MSKLIRRLSRVIPFELINILDYVIPEPLRLAPIWIDVGHNISVEINSGATLATFSEIFFRKVYAPALNLVDKPDIIVDLGANKGLFSLYACHHFLEQQLEIPEFWCIEAAEANLRRLQRQIRNNHLVDRFHLVKGVVTNTRSGSVQFRYTPRASGRSRIAKRNYLTAQQVPIIDLAAHLRNVPSISLIKMDIEGAEEGVIQEYPEVFAKTQLLIVEFHLDSIDYGRCVELLQTYGLEYHSRVYEHSDLLCVEIFRKR